MIIKLQDSANGGFYFEIQSEGNYETIATSETYETKRAAQAAIGLIVAGPFTLVDAT